MKEHEYPFFEEHKREHEVFLEDYTECMVQFLNGADISAKDPIEECLKEWIVDHITSSDKKMALMVQDTQKATMRSINQNAAIPPTA